MSERSRLVLSIIVVLLGCTSSVVLLARHRPKANDAVVTAVTELVEVNLTGSYKGTVYLRNKSGKGYLMIGETTLYINEDKSFQLVNQASALVTGEIKTWIIPEKDNLGVGQVILRDGETIEIRWHRDPVLDTLKILRARGAKRQVRFCSINLTKEQCFGWVSTPASASN